MAVKYFQLPENRPNGYKIYQDFLLQDPQKFTQIGIFGLKTNHLATLIRNPRKGQLWHSQITSLKEKIGFTQDSEYVSSIFCSIGFSFRAHPAQTIL
jgi:hypothetical protein